MRKSTVFVLSVIACTEQGESGLTSSICILSSVPEKASVSTDPLYRYTSDYDKRNAFDIERFLSNRLRIRPDDRYQVKKVDLSDEAPAAE